MQSRAEISRNSIAELVFSCCDFRCTFDCNARVVTPRLDEIARDRARASAEGIHGGHRRAISISSSRDAYDASDDLRAREHPETVRLPQSWRWRTRRKSRW
jgi:hypothetical protein